MVHVLVIRDEYSDDTFADTPSQSVIGAFQGEDERAVYEEAGKLEEELNRLADRLERFWLLVHHVPVVDVR